MEPTPRGRLAAIMRATIYRYYDFGRKYPPDYADFETDIDNQVTFEILTAKLEEAKLKPANEPRVRELITKLAQLVGSRIL